MQGTLFARRRRRAKPMFDRRRLTALRLALLGIAAIAGAPDVVAQTDADEEYVGPLVNQALETEKSGVEIPWSNPATGSSGMILIERTFYRDPRTPCRDYRRTLERAGAPTLEVQGTGCRIGSGRWSLDEEAPKSVAAAPSGRTATPRTSDPTAAPDAAPARAETAPPSCPAPSAAPVACDERAPVVDYTMPTRTEL